MGSSLVEDASTAADGLSAQLAKAETNEEKVELIKRAAASLYKQREYARATILYTRALGLDPKNPHLYASRSACRLDRARATTEPSPPAPLNLAPSAPSALRAAQASTRAGACSSGTWDATRS